MKRPPTYITRLLAWLGILCLMPVSAYALKNDKDQPVVIDADNIELDLETGVRTYTGNVKVQQGTLVIHADKMVVRYKDDELQTATAYGKPARFKQRPENKDEDVRGRAPKIIFDEPHNKLHMYRKAVLIQGKNTIHSKEIHYDTAKEKMIVKGGAPGKPGKKSGRARIVIQPKEHKASPGR